MAKASIRFLILHKQLSFSLNIKRTLEALGGFEVAPFTTPQTALDYLRAHPQHLALVDFTFPGVAGRDIAREFRVCQPDLLLIASPDLPQVVSIARHMKLDGITDAPTTARALIPVLRRVLSRMDDLPDATRATLRMEAPPTDDDDDRMIAASSRATESRPLDPEEQARTIEFVLKADVESLRDSGEIPESISDEVLQSFKRLAAEEPPMPTLDEHGTVHDLRVIVTDDEGTTNRQPALPPPAPLADETADEPNPRLVENALRVVEDDTIPLEQLRDTLGTELPNTREGALLPAWLRSVGRYVDEPDFLDDVAGGGLLAGDDSEKPAAPQVPPPPDGLPGHKPPPALPAYEFPQEEAPESEPPDALGTSTRRPDPPPPATPPAPVNVSLDDPQIAQIALNLTQAATDLTAEMAVLAREGQIIAHAGILPIEEVDSISDLLADDWGAKPGEARIRFITLPDSGRDYMIHSRQTEDGLTLSLVFAGNMPLRVMRLQSDKLLQALTSVPELPAPDGSLLDALQEREIRSLEATAAEVIGSADAAAHQDDEADMDSVEVPEDAPALTAYTVVWMLADPQATLPQRTAHAIKAGLERDLTALGWVVDSLQVHEDYVYLLADVPVGDTAFSAIVADLKERAAWIAHEAAPTLDPSALWADGYCALFPGRDLDPDEIQRYINFARL